VWVGGGGEEMGLSGEVWGEEVLVRSAVEYRFERYVRLVDSFAYEVGWVEGEGGEAMAM